MNANIREHYRSLFLKHGDSVESAQWSSRATQERRFDLLLQIGDLRGCSVLDFGCGTGHLATYLEARGIAVAYTGVDIVDEMLAAGQAKHPRHRFCRFDEIRDRRFDYVMICGVFGNKRRDNRRFYRETLRRCFALADRGLAFNLLSSYVDYRDPGLFYEEPEAALRFAKRELTPFVTLRHDYGVKPGVIPFEFTVYAYRKASP